MRCKYILNIVNSLSKVWFLVTFVRHLLLVKSQTFSRIRNKKRVLPLRQDPLLSFAKESRCYLWTSGHTTELARVLSGRQLRSAVLS